MRNPGGTALAACLAAPARWGERAGVILPDQATVEGTTLVLGAVSGVLR